MKKITKLEEIDYTVEEVAYVLSESFDVYTEDSELTNGQTITAKISFDGSRSKLEECGIKVDFTPLTFKVEGLTEPIAVDVFENLDVVIEGVSPALRVSLKEKEAGKYGFSVTYSLNNGSYYSDYKIGDNLNIVAQFSESAAIDKGYIVTSKEKTVTIDNTMAEAYVQDANQLSADLKALAKSEADKKAQQQFTNQNSGIDIESTYITLAEAESISEMEAFKTYLVYSDDPGLGVSIYEEAYNYICVVYKFRVNNANEAFVWEDAPEFHYDGYSYGYIFVPNITVKNGEIKYDLSKIGSNSNAFTSVDTLLNYLTNHNYTYTEITGM